MRDLPKDFKKEMQNGAIIYGIRHEQFPFLCDHRKNNEGKPELMTARHIQREDKLTVVCYECSCGNRMWTGNNDT